MVASRIMYDGRALPIEASCREGVAFPQTRKRPNPPEMLVFHWTGGERGDAAIYKTLVDRGLSVDFTIDYAGQIVQHNDPAHVYTLHCGPQNVRAIGVEIQNRGFPGRSVTGKDRGSKPKAQVTPSDIARLKGLNARAVETCVIHGRTVDVCLFTTEQLDAACALLHALVPRVIKPIVHTGQTVMPADKIGSFEGVCGHYHLSRQKYDPGPQLMRVLFDELSG